MSITASCAGLNQYSSYTIISPVKCFITALASQRKTVVYLGIDNKKRLPLAEGSLMKDCSDGLSDVLGIELLHFNGTSVNSRMLITDKHLAPNGYLHAAAVVALADITCGRGTDANLPENANGFTTIELKSNFMGTCREGHIYCEAVAEHIGRTTQVWSATVLNKFGEKLALFRCTQMILRR